MKDEVNRELIRSLQETNASENEDLYQRADQTKSYEEAIPGMQDYKKIIRFKKKGILNIALT